MPKIKRTIDPFKHTEKPPPPGTEDKIEISTTDAVTVLQEASAVFSAFAKEDEVTLVSYLSRASRIRIKAHELWCARG